MIHIAQREELKEELGKHAEDCKQWKLVLCPKVPKNARAERRAVVGAKPRRHYGGARLKATPTRGLEKSPNERNGHLLNSSSARETKRENKRPLITSSRTTLHRSLWRRW